MSKEPAYTPDPQWIGKDYYTTPELAKAAYPALGVGDSAILLLTPEKGLVDVPPSQYIVTTLSKVITQGEAKVLTADWLFWTGFTLLEYFNAKGQWSCVATQPKPRSEVDELKLQLSIAQRQLKAAKELIGAVAPFANSYMAHQQLGSQVPFERWLVISGHDETERKARAKVVQLLVNPVVKELIKS